MTTDSNGKGRPPVQAATRMGTGSSVLPGVDGRTGPARRYKELVANMAADLGGDLPTAKQAVVNRAATLIVWAEKAEAEFANSGELDTATYTTAINSLRRLLADIGLDRRAKDITPTLSEYISSYDRKRGSQ